RLQPSPGVLPQAVAKKGPYRQRCGWWKQIPVGIGFHNAAEDVGNRFAGKSLLPGEHFVEHATETPNIGLLSCLLSPYLLGTHIGSRAENDSGSRVTHQSWRIRCVRIFRFTFK